jgi:hypothetical protein
VADEQKNIDVVEKRKASDILLGVEDRVNTLIKIMSVYDMNTKLLLERVNFIYSYIKQVQALDEAQLTSPPASLFPEPIQASSEHIITEEQNPIGHRRTPRSDFFNNAESMPSTVATPLQQIAQDQLSDKKVPVIQRVTDGKGKDLFMAEVIIFDEQKQVVVKTKTNAAGKWQAYLRPGKYNVSIVKTDTATKNEIKADQNINIVGSNISTITTLPAVVIKR